MKVKDKVIIVTGGGSGIGRELVLQLLKRGARVAAVDLNAASLEETARLAAAPDRLATFTASVADQAAMEALPGQVVARFGVLDGVINNAGIIQPFVRLQDLPWEDIRRVVDVNLYGTLYLTKAALPILLGRPVAHVVNIASMGGFLPVPGQTIYGAAKAAVKLMTEGLWAECIGTPVRATIVFPGAIATNISTNSGVKIDMPADQQGKSGMTAMPAPDAARIILDGLEEDAFRVLVGKDASFLDKFYRASPRRATAFIADKMKALLGG